MGVILLTAPCGGRTGGDAGDLQGHDLPAGAGHRRLDDAGGETSRASWQTALGLGFVSAVFDNIPLTALALKQGGYDWGFLAYAVGFGGSMIWFGSSAGVALGEHVSGSEDRSGCGCATAGMSRSPM